MKALKLTTNGHVEIVRSLKGRAFTGQSIEVVWVAEASPLTLMYSECILFFGWPTEAYQEDTHAKPEELFYVEFITPLGRLVFKPKNGEMSKKDIPADQLPDAYYTHKNSRGEWRK